MGFHGIISCVLRAREDLQKSWNVHGKYTFINRQHGAPNLVVVLIGFKPKLWTCVVPRLHQALTATSSLAREFDVCLVTPGSFNPHVASLAQHHKWSYLHTAANRVSLAQNLAVLIHP